MNNPQDRLKEILARARMENEVRRLLLDYQEKKELSSEDMLNVIASSLASQIFKIIAEEHGEDAWKKVSQFRKRLNDEVQCWTDETLINFSKGPIDD